jgi:hypothetical protein
MALIDENGEPAAVSVPFGVGMAEIARAAARCGRPVEDVSQMAALIGDANIESSAIGRGGQLLVKVAVRPAAALAAEDRLIGGGRG